MYNTYDVHFYSGVCSCIVEDKELEPMIIDRQTVREIDRQAERQIDICQSVSQSIKRPDKQFERYLVNSQRP